MRRIFCGILMALLLISLAGCSGGGNIVGTWEREMEISILGVEGEATVSSTARFTFREDGTGIQAQILPDGSHPDAVREFSWQLEGDTLVLDYGENQREEFTASISKSSLKLESHRGSYDLTKAK